MKRLIIICEGQTEQEFCKDILAPHLFALGIIIQAPTIKKSGGGIVSWSELRKQIENHLKQESEVFVTTLIDYYGLREKHQIPDWALAHTRADKVQRMNVLENGMRNAIDESLRHRFIPYIQLHEFEGLLFNEMSIFDSNFEPAEFTDRAELIRVINAHPNPEMLNDGTTTAPSKRLIQLISGYNKIVYGACLAHSIGLTRIMQKCPRFTEWIPKLSII